MAISHVVWVIDTSSIIEVKRSTRKSQREQIFREMTRLVTEGRLVYPPEVVAELERYAQPKSPDRQFAWAKQNASTAHGNGSCSLDDVREVLGYGLVTHRYDQVAELGVSGVPVRSKPLERRGRGGCVIGIVVPVQIVRA